MIRLRLFFLFIAFALLALVRPRKCLEMLEAADLGTAAVRRDALKAAIHHNGPPDLEAARLRLRRWAEEREALDEECQRLAELATQECVLPPPGWRCTRAGGHEGPCAAVEVGS